MPLGLLLIFCVLVMHGFQAAPSPVEMIGVPITGMSAEQHPAPHAPSDEKPAEDHENHPGGQICLAVLVLLAFALTLFALHRTAPMFVVLRLRARVRILLVGRPPPRPSLHRLSVLRL